MACTECARNPEATVRVEYADGRKEILRLCRDYRQNHADGKFVEEVAPMETNNG
jgi:hypothetical protein